MKEGLLRGIAIVGFATVLLTPVIAVAQTTATITGTVTDDTGAIVPKTAISITDVGTGQTRSLVADNRGQYAALSLPVGQYEVRPESAGFALVRSRGVKVSVP